MSLNETNPPLEGPAAPPEVNRGVNPGDQAGAIPEPTAKARPAPREPLYFVVVLLLIADIVFGLGLAVFADKVIDFRPMAVVGLGLAGLGLGILAYFVLLGSGKPKR